MLSERSILFPLSSRMLITKAMPKTPKESSTQRRKRLANIIDLYGDLTSKSCSNCARYSRSCYVHARSTRCGECNRHGLANCDIHISGNKWQSLQEERESLVAQWKEARRATEAAFAREQEARKMMATVWAREELLQHRLSLLHKRADKAIATEEATLVDQEITEASVQDHSALKLSLDANVDSSYLPTNWDPLSDLDIAVCTSDPSTLNINFQGMDQGGQQLRQF